jgi:hypothetical protein
MEASRQLADRDSEVMYSGSTSISLRRPRFAFSGGQTSYGGSWSSSRYVESFEDGALQELRRKEMAALAATGRRDEALAIEESLLRRAELSIWWRDWARRRIGEAYFAVGLFAEGERVIRTDPAMGRDERSSLLVAMLDAARRCGTMDDVSRLGRELVAEYDRLLAIDPDAHAIALRRAAVRSNALSDFDAAGAEIDALAARFPWWRDARLEGAWNELLAGRPAPAVARFEEARRRGDVEGEPPPASFDFGYGRALVESGQVERGRALLRGALVNDPRNPHAARSRSLLD